MLIYETGGGELRGKFRREGFVETPLMVVKVFGAIVNALDL